MKRSLMMLALLLSLICSSWASAGVHLVKKGECLSQIAQKAGVPWQKIAEANGIKNPNMIRVGEILQIPDKKTNPKKVAQQVVKAKAVVAASPTTEKATKRIVNDTPGDQTKNFKPAIFTVKNLQAKPIPVVLIAKNQKPEEKAEVKSNDSLGDRIDSLFKLTHRERISGDANKNTNVFYGDIVGYPFKFGENYLGIGGTYLDVWGETNKKSTFDVRYWFLGPQYKWKPQGEGQEFVAGIGFGNKEKKNFSHSAEMLELSYSNWQGKMAGKTSFNEWCIWASVINSDTVSLSIGGRFYLKDWQNGWRLYADANGNLENPNAALALGIGVTDRQNIIEIGAGLRGGTQGLEWWVGPAVRPDNLLNSVTLKPVREVVEITPDGIQLVKKTVESPPTENGLSLDPMGNPKI